MDFSPNYILATDAGYNFQIANEGYVPYDPNVLYLKHMFKDVQVTRPGRQTDISLLHTKALMTVNGYVHPTAWTDGKLYIKEAMTTTLKTNNNSVGIISFYDYKGVMKRHRITEKMITRDGDYTLYEKTVITFPEQIDSLVLIYMGYIITENERYLKRISDRTFEFFPNRINYLEKIYELNRYRDIFKELDVPEAPKFDSAVNYSDLTSDKTIINTLTRFNTFVVEFEKATIKYEPKYLERTSVPNNYRTEHEPMLPMFGAYGKMIEYKCMKFNNVKYTLLTTDSYYNRLMFSYKPEIVQTVINNTRKIDETFDLNAAYLLKMKIKRR